MSSMNEKESTRFVTSFSFPLSFKPILDEIKSIAAERKMSVSSLIAELLTDAVKRYRYKAEELAKIEVIDLVSKVKAYIKNVKEDLKGPVTRSDLKTIAEVLNNFLSKLNTYKDKITYDELDTTISEVKDLMKKILKRYETITPEEEEEAEEERLRKFIREHARGVYVE